MVTATTGNVIFQAKSGKQYAYSCYISDVSAAFVTFSASGPAGTGSQNFLIAPEDMILVDFSTLLSPTVAVTVSPYFNDLPSGLLIQDANTLSSLPTRSFPRFGLRAGTKLTMLQA